MKLRRRLIFAYDELERESPGQTSAIIQRILKVRDALEQQGLPIDARPSRALRLGSSALLKLAFALLLSPLALIGFVTHAPAYYLVRFIAFRFAADAADVAATVKLVAGLLFFPLGWGVLTSFAYFSRGPEWGLFLLLLLPASAWSNVRFLALYDSARRSFRLKRGTARAALDWEEVTAERACLAEQVAELVLSIEDQSQKEGSSSP